MGSIEFSIIETNVTHYITFKPRNCNSPSCVDPPLLATLGPVALMVEFPRSYLDPALLFFVGISYWDVINQGSMKVSTHFLDAGSKILEAS